MNDLRVVKLFLDAHRISSHKWGKVPQDFISTSLQIWKQQFVCSEQYARCSYVRDSPELVSCRILY